MDEIVNTEYDDDEVNLERVGKELMAGGLSGTLGIIVGLPFDIVKVRMQMYPSRYTSGINCFMTSVRADGFTSLYRGMMAPVISQSPINAILFAAEESAMRYLEPNVPKENQSQISHVLAGAFAGLVQCGVLVPADRVKCLVQADGIANEGANAAERKYKGTIDCAAQLLKSEGIRGFYKGFSATATREIPSLGVYFSSYKYVAQTCKKFESSITYYNPTAVTLFAGGCAGAMSWIVVYPFDVIKTQIQGSNKYGNNTSVLSVGKMLYQQHGWKIFTLGLSTTIARAFPVNAITFACYEQLKTFLKL